MSLRKGLWNVVLVQARFFSPFPISHVVYKSINDIKLLLKKRHMSYIFQRTETLKGKWHVLLVDVTFFFTPFFRENWFLSRKRKNELIIATTLSHSHKQVVSKEVGTQNTENKIIPQILSNKVLNLLFIIIFFCLSLFYDSRLDA